MIYVFLGNEINLLKRRIDDLKRELNINNIIEYDFDDSNIIDILNEANYVDLFNEKKLIIVSNFSFKKVKDVYEKELLRYIDNMNDNVIILKCIDESLDERKNICEYNDDLAINETEKLLLYKLGEDVITDDDIDKVVSKSSEKEIFTLSDAVMKKNLKQIFNSYNILIRSGIEPVVLIDNLARQFRTLYQVKILCKTMDEKEISRKLGLNPYVVKKAHENVNNYEEEELINNLYELSNLDIDIKVKGLDKYKVLENFFLKI